MIVLQKSLLSIWLSLVVVVAVRMVLLTLFLLLLLLLVAVGGWSAQCRVCSTRRLGGGGGGLQLGCASDGELATSQGFATVETATNETPLERRWCGGVGGSAMHGTGWWAGGAGYRHQSLVRLSLAAVAVVARSQFGSWCGVRVVAVREPAWW
jgi:hypothetical protein